MNVVTHFLTHIGLWPTPHLSRGDVQHAKSVLTTARHEANQLADELEKLADDDNDAFEEFATRARHSRFLRRGDG